MSASLAENNGFHYLNNNVISLSLNRACMKTWEKQTTN